MKTAEEIVYTIDRLLPELARDLDQFREKRRLARLRDLKLQELESCTPRIRMVISPWYRDEAGNLTRTIRAAE